MLLVNKYLILSNFSHRSRLEGKKPLQTKSLLRENLQNFLHVSFEENFELATYG